MKMSISAEGTNGLRHSDMELEAVMDQHHRQGHCGAAGIKS